MILAHRKPLTPALSPRRGEGDYFLGTLPRAAVRAGRATMRTLPWANIFLPLQGGSLAACAASWNFRTPTGCSECRPN
jgi:hypothetical protein